MHLQTCVKNCTSGTSLLLLHFSEAFPTQCCPRRFCQRDHGPLESCFGPHTPSSNTHPSRAKSEEHERTLQNSSFVYVHRCLTVMYGHDKGRLRIVSPVTLSRHLLNGQTRRNSASCSLNPNLKAMKVTKTGCFRMLRAGTSLVSDVSSCTWSCFLRLLLLEFSHLYKCLS